MCRDWEEREGTDVIIVLTHKILNKLHKSLNVSQVKLINVS